MLIPDSTNSLSKLPQYCFIARRSHTNIDSFAGMGMAAPAIPRFRQRLCLFFRDVHHECVATDNKALVSLRE